MDPFHIDSPTCISFSGGRTSAYMLHRVLESNGGLPKDATVCFANTGREDEATLRFVRDCAESWQVPIVWLEFGGAVVSFETASRNGEPFSALIDKKSYLPNPIARFCTSDLKIKPIDVYLKALGWVEFEMMVGIRADEPRRVAKMAHLSTPLARAGVTRPDVMEFWAANRFDLDLRSDDGLTPLGNCDLCFLKGGAQILSLIREKPSRAIWWAAQEEKIGASFRSDRPSYSAMKAFAEEQGELFDPTEEAIACFCGD